MNKKEPKGGILSILLRTLTASILKNLLGGRGLLKKKKWRSTKSKWTFLMLPYPLTYFETEKCYQSKCKIYVFVQQMINLNKRMGHI